MLELTTTERDELTKKFEALTQFKKYFPSGINTYGVSQCFTTRELLDERVQNYIDQNVDGSIKSSKARLLIDYAKDTPSLSHDERIQILKICCSKYNLNRKPLADFWRSAFYPVMFASPEMPSRYDCLKTLKAENFLSDYFKNRSEYNEFVEHELSVYTPDGTNDYLGLLHEIATEDFEKWPILITNKNISKEEKINILKKTYKQKDLSKYISYFKEINDLEVIDILIETVVFQNNRVREKNKVLQTILQRIFLDPSTNLSLNRNYKYFQEFTKKYREFFKDVTFAQEFLKKSVLQYSTNQYTRETLYKEFIIDLFRTASKEEVLTAIKKNAALSSLIDTLGQRYIKDIQDNAPDTDEYIHVLETLEFKSNKNKIDNFIGYVAREENLSAEEQLIKFGERGLLKNLFREIYIDPLKYNTGNAGIIFKLLLQRNSVELMKEFKLTRYSSEFLFMDIEDMIKNSTNYRNIISININIPKTIKSIFYTISEYLSTKKMSKEMANVLIEKFFIPFEEEFSPASAIAFQNITVAMTSKNISSSYRSDFVDYMRDMVDIVLPNTAKELYDFVEEYNREEKTLESLKEVSNNLKLYSQIN